MALTLDEWRFVNDLFLTLLTLLVLAFTIYIAVYVKKEDIREERRDSRNVYEHRNRYRE